MRPDSVSCLVGRWVVCLILPLIVSGCQKTGKLSPELTARFEKEGIVRRADDLTFRRTTAVGQHDLDLG